MNKINKKRENTKSAIEATEAVLDENSDVVTAYPALNDGVTLFKGDFANYEKDEAAFYQEMDGKTPAKHTTKDAVVTAIHSLGRALRSYSKKANKPDIFDLANVEESKLEKMRDTALLDYTKKVIAKANDNAVDLAGYNVTADELAGVQTKIDDYEKSLKAQVGGMADKSGEFDALEASLRKVKDDLDDIDDMMERIKDGHPEFYDAYHAARPVKALGVRHNPPPAPSGEPPAQTKSE